MDWGGHWGVGEFGEGGDIEGGVEGVLVWGDIGDAEGALGTRGGLGGASEVGSLGELGE